LLIQAPFHLAGTLGPSPVVDATTRERRPANRWGATEIKADR